MRRERACAFAPGRVNLIGEHTDYNLGLALPFAIAEGVTVRAQATDPHAPDAQRIYARAYDLGEEDASEAIVQASRDLLKADRCGVRRCKFDRQRHAIQPFAYRCD